MACYIWSVRVDIDLDDETAKITAKVERTLQRCADRLGEIDDNLVDIKRSLLDIARNYRKALGKGAAIHVADGADEMRDESAGD